MQDSFVSTPPDADRAPVVAVRYIVLAWLCLAAALVYGQRLTLGVGATVVQNDLALSDLAMGWAMGAFFITYAIFQIPGGRMADRLGSRAALAVCLTFCSLATVCTGAATGLTSLMLVRLAAGAGQAGIFPAATASIARWFPSTRAPWRADCWQDSCRLAARLWPRLAAGCLRKWIGAGCSPSSACRVSRGRRASMPGIAIGPNSIRAWALASWRRSAAHT